MKTLLIGIFIFQSINLYAQNGNSNYKPKYNTIAHEILKTEQSFSNRNSNQYGEMLLIMDSLITNASKKIKIIQENIQLDKKQKAVNILKAISNSISEFGFGLRIPTRNLTHMFLTKKVDCDTGAILYLAISEVNNLPVYMVEVPNHNFIRFYYNDASYLNWDNNTSMEVTDSEFMKGESGTSSSTFTIKQAVFFRYLQSMSYNSVLSYFYSLIEVEKNPLKMKELYEAGITERPFDPLIMNNFSWFILTSKEFEDDEAENKKALELSLKVDRLIPHDSNYKDTLGCAYAANGQFKKAIEVESNYGGNDKKQIDAYKVGKKCVQLGF